MSRGGEEELPPCTKQSLVYENICVECNPGARGKIEQEELKTDIPTVYIGETSRSIFERSKEHWEGARKGCGKNHMVKHQIMEHGGEQEPNFHMKVRGFFKTALARQVAEAVLIRRRGGEGAILNSRGEFSRSHIPRLQVVEEEPQPDTRDRELTTKLLREQDKDWEKHKALELGAEAILGPGASPTKRPIEMEEEGGAIEKSSKRRRKRWRHKVLEEGWGELQPIQGADGGNSTAPTNPHVSLTREQEQLNKPGELIGPPETVTERELDLKQLEITTFLKPVDNSQDWPTTQNLADGIPPDPPATRTSSGGSPSRYATTSLLDDKVEGNSFGGAGGWNDGVGNDLNLMGGNTTDLSDECERMIVLQSGETDTMNVGSAAPSVGDVVQTGANRKPVLDSMPGLARCSGPDLSGGVEKSTMKGCEFKRGGMCMLHGVVGTKYVEKSKSWAKNKNGTFGWKHKSTTKYVCQYEGAVKSNVCENEDDSRSEGVAKSNLMSAGIGGVEKTTALGGTYRDTGFEKNLSWVSGNDYRTAGSFESESERKGSMKKDSD